MKPFQGWGFGIPSAHYYSATVPVIIMDYDGTALGVGDFGNTLTSRERSREVSNKMPNPEGVPL